MMARKHKSSQRQIPLDFSGNQGSLEGKNGSSFSDPSFAINKKQPIHRWVPWIAGFSKEFVDEAISNYLGARSLVLDPFAGVGTTLVESILQGHDAIGFEINPYAALACRLKTNAHHLDSNALKKEIIAFREFYNKKSSSNYIPRSTPPEGFRTRGVFYSPNVLRKVLILNDFISFISQNEIRDVFKLAFASTMIRYSNYSYEPSLGRRVSAGKADIADYPVDLEVLSKLDQMHEDIHWLNSNLTEKSVRSTIIHDSFFKYAEYLSPESVDLIITSPPYLNNYHYNRNTRPHLYWLGYAERPKDFKPLEESNFGKFWQTVREHEGIELEFELQDSDLTDRIEHLKTLNPEKGNYGGHGWANYAASYFNDCYRFAEGINHSLKSGGVALVVIGNSILQGLMIPTDQYFGKISESLGLELVGIEIPRRARVGNSIIQSEVRVGKAKDSHQLYEAIVELRKP